METKTIFSFVFTVARVRNEDKHFVETTTENEKRIYGFAFAVQWRNTRALFIPRFENSWKNAIKSEQGGDFGETFFSAFSPATEMLDSICFCFRSF